MFYCTESVTKTLLLRNSLIPLLDFNGELEIHFCFRFFFFFLRPGRPFFNIRILILKYRNKSKFEEINENQLIL